MSADEAALQAEINAAVKKLDALVTLVKKEKQGILMNGAKIVRDEIFMAAPIGTKVHKRYSTPKVSKKIRAPKGMGVVTATYAPSNLKWAMQVLKFNQSAAVFVGAKLAKGKSATGQFGGTSDRSDGYYAHMVEFGTAKMPPHAFIRPAVAAVKEYALQTILRDFKTKIDDFARQNAV